MESSGKLYEKYLHEIWQNQSFTKPLRTFDHNTITVLDPGVYNESSAGPDFQHCRLQIGAITYVGDVEIDLDYHDWKRHGHNIDSKYNKVILHVSFTNNQKHHYVFTKAGRKVPNVSIKNFIDPEIAKNLFENYKTFESSTIKNIKCAGLSNDVKFKVKKEFVINLGIQRFNKKSKRIFDRLKELVFLEENQIAEPVIRYELSKQFREREFTYEDFKKTDVWKQLFYELMFEALGYSKNKSPMLKLAKYANLNILNKINDTVTNDKIKLFESVFYNVSGIMPDVNNLPASEVDDYQKELNEIWQTVKDIYDSETLNETQWHFLNNRPQNFPTIRIAGGVRLLNMLLYGDLIPKLIKKFEEIRSDRVLINSVRSLFIVKSEGYWTEHYIFGKPAKDKIKYFVGASRSDEIVVNIVLPFLYVYFEVFGKTELAKRILKIYQLYTQKSDNKIVRDVAEGIGLDGYKKRTIFAQGMIELFRSYCSKGKCLECEIGKTVFE